MHGPGSLTAHSELDVRPMVRGPRQPGTAAMEPHRIHRDLYVSSAVFEAEMSSIFGRSWVYVGHESEVAELT
jgi:hypothetical protein